MVDAGEMGYVGVAAIGFWDVGSIVTSPSNKTLWDGGFDAPTLTPGMTIKKGQYVALHFLVESQMYQLIGSLGRRPLKPSPSPAHAALCYFVRSLNHRPSA